MLDARPDATMIKFSETFSEHKVYFNTSFLLSKTADWLTKARVEIKFTIRGRFRTPINWRKFYDLSLRIESFAILHLRDVSTKL